MAEYLADLMVVQRVGSMADATVVQSAEKTVVQRVHCKAVQMVAL
jgi:hypothetical protein